MKLQKQLSRKVGNKEYPKWLIVIPPHQVEELGWQEGEFLENEIKDQKLIIKKEDADKAEKRSEASRKAWVKRKKSDKR